MTIDRSAVEKLAKILNVAPAFLVQLEETMMRHGLGGGVLQKISALNEEHTKHLLDELHVPFDASAETVRTALKNLIAENEEKLLAYMASVEGNTEFEKAVHLARSIARVDKGFFLKKEFGAEILKKCKPEKLLTFLGYATVEEMLARHDVTEVFSALRFIESEEWMHETFKKAYSGFTAKDFEERDIEIKVLGPEWTEVAKKFVEKKHHNVSHLKEFGVIFLNPIKEDVRGKFLRDFALLFHYFHEIAFYSMLFKKYAAAPDFADHFQALLRGDVKETKTVGEAEWLIVQRYLFKIDPRDPRLFLPRVNPESVHWFRGERDIVAFGKANPSLGLSWWTDLDWAGYIFRDGKEEVVSLDLEDNAMEEVSAVEGKNEHLNYHQREALWTRLFMEYVGGEAEMQKLLIENFEKGTIIFP